MNVLKPGIEVVAMDPIVTLCIPTNGMTEWVIPVLDSIFSQNVDESKFEVVIEDNGHKDGFASSIKKYQKNHANLHYYKSTSEGFLCQIDSFKDAKGRFIKFVNHRSRLLPGALAYMVAFAERNALERPVVFFSNGSVKESESTCFDGFVANLSYYSSWSGGLAFWKEDIGLVRKREAFNPLFPHMDILFMRQDAPRYIILDREIFHDIDAGHGAKGDYNLFFAFAVEYPSVINGLLREGDISADTFLKVKEDLLGFLADLYVQFIIRKKEASYRFDDHKKYLEVYYSKGELYQKILCLMAKKALKKAIRR